MPDWLRGVGAFIFLSLAHVFMRTFSLLTALHMLWRLLPHGHVLGYSALKELLPPTPTTLFRPVALGEVLAVFFTYSMESTQAFRPSLGTELTCALLIVNSLFYMSSAPARAFVYFAF